MRGGMRGNGSGGLESTSIYEGYVIRVVTTYLQADDLTEIVVYVRAPNGAECAAQDIPHHTANHRRADAMGYEIGRFWIRERE